MAKKRCCYCGKIFIPDPRVGNRQKACSSQQCQKQRKGENNRTFRRNNPGYWNGRYEYVKEWRDRNPEYQKRWRQRKKQKEQTYPEIQAEIGIKRHEGQALREPIIGEIQVYIELLCVSDREFFMMKERIHRRLPVEFVKEVLEAFNAHKISEKEAMKLLGIKRSRLHQLRKRWLRSIKKRPFSLWQRVNNAFHVISSDVKQQQLGCPQILDTVSVRGSL